jgi:uncharacterized phiE125 gp8 family phage protein
MITENDSKNDNKNWIIITEPESYPVTVEEIKEFARIDGNDEDSILESFLIGVVNDTEAYLKKALITRQYKMIMDAWNDKEIELPMPPLISVQSIKTIDEDGNETVYDSDNYYVVTESIPGKIIIKKNSQKPLNSERESGGYEIIFTAGYGNDASSVPKQIRIAIMQWVTMIYENRSMTDSETLKNEPPPEVKKILKTYRIARI